MRHNKKFNHLGRTASHRDAMLANMAVSLIMHKRITTTLAKAKALKKYVEPLITRSKEDTTNSRRVVFRYLQKKEAIKELFSTVAAKVADRPGGYTRVIKLGTRQGDAAEIAFIELVSLPRLKLLQRLLLQKLQQLKRLKQSNLTINIQTYNESVVKFFTTLFICPYFVFVLLSMSEAIPLCHYSVSQYLVEVPFDVHEKKTKHIFVKD